MRTGQTKLKLLAPLMASAKQDWQTPDNVLDVVRSIAPIALDVCTVDSNPTGAARFYTPKTDGLGGRSPWDVYGPDQALWMNPPYGRACVPWVQQWCEVVGANMDSHMFALVPARTDTGFFHDLMSYADRVCFVRGRLVFRGAPAGAPFPSALFYAGCDPGKFESACDGLGWTVRP